MLKQFSVMLVILLMTLTLAGCADAEADKRSNPDNQDKANVTTQEALEDIDRLSYSENDIYNFMKLPKDSLLKKLGNEYESANIGAEGVYEGYVYDDMGLAFGFYNNTLELITCSDDTLVNGVQNTMTFEQVISILGKATLHTGWEDGAQKNLYWVSYPFNLYNLQVSSWNETGEGSWITIGRDVKVTAISSKDISQYLSKNKSEIMDTLQGKYCDIVPAGIDYREKGYYYEDLGLVFIFNSDDSLKYIELHYDFKLDNKDLGYDFDGLKRALGEGEISTASDSSGKKLYKLSYSFDEFTVLRQSVDSSGNNSQTFLIKNVE